MIRQSTSIKRKLTFAILGTTIAVLLLTAAGFVSYELITFQRWMESYVRTAADIIVLNSTASLSFGDEKSASETLSTVSVEPHIDTAALYGSNGEIFVYWPTNTSRDSFPSHPGTDGFQTVGDFLVYFHPVMQGGVRQGTLYLKSDFGARRERFGKYAVIVAIVLSASVLVAVLLSRFLQRGISQPILALADTAHAISTRRDYSVRAVKLSNDEVGVLTDAFNHMLTQIQERAEALRQNEERFRQLANAVPAHVWTADARGLAVYFNEPWYEYTGRTPQDSLGLKWTDALHPDDRERCVRLWHDAVENARGYESEGRFRRFDDEYRWFLKRAHLARDAAGQVTSWFGTNTDIDDKKRAEESVNQMNVSLEQRVQERTSQLEASNRELEAFSYSVAHDLRAPLRAIDGFNQAVIEDYGEQLPEEARNLFQRSRLASQRMSQLIDDLLNLSRVARADIRKQTVNLSEMAAALSSELEKAAPQRKVKVQIEPGLRASADERLLRLALGNLFDNAFKFTRTKSEGSIEFGHAMLQGERVFFVRDNGAGFDMQFAGKLFGPFQRLHSAREYPGTGIGLATVHRIILRHGGRIWPHSELGCGTTFYFTLPD